MGLLLILVGTIFAVVGLVCSIIVLVAAFKDEAWKGIASFLCGLYGLYYMVAEFRHERKWLIVFGALAGGTIGYFLTMAGVASMAPRANFVQ